MTSEKMQYYFGTVLDQYDFDLSIDSDDIFYFLNWAQQLYIENRFDPDNPTREGFEQNQKIIDELKPLVKKNEELSASFVSANGAITGSMAFRATFPQDLMYLISYRCEVEYPANKDDVLSNGTITSGQTTRKILSNSRFVQLDDNYKLLKDPFNKPRKQSPLVDINQNNIDIYTDGSFIINKVFINYIKQPKKIIFNSSGDSGNQDCELPTFVHEDIVELAVNLLLKSRSKFNPQKQDK